MIVTPRDGLMMFPAGTSLTAQYRVLQEHDRFRSRHLHDRRADAPRAPMTSRPARLALAVVAMRSCAALVHPAAIIADSPLSTRVHRYLMGTSMTIEVSGGDAASRADVIDEAFASMVEIDRLMSNYRADSELIGHQHAGRGASGARERSDVGRALGGADGRASGAAARSTSPWGRSCGSGAFTTRSRTCPPTRNCSTSVPSSATRTSSSRRGPAVSFKRSGVELDLGGIAKGFAVELAGGVLRRRGYCRSDRAGGNQYLVGHPAGKASWQIGIEDPDKPGGLLGVLDLDGGAVSTSGGYHNFFVADGKTYGHLLDPRVPQAERLGAQRHHRLARCDAGGRVEQARIHPRTGGGVEVRGVVSRGDGDHRDAEGGGGVDRLVMSEPLRSKFRRAGLKRLRSRPGESTSACQATPPRRACRAVARVRVDHDDPPVRGADEALLRSAWSMKPASGA